MVRVSSEWDTHPGNQNLKLTEIFYIHYLQIILSEGPGPFKSLFKCSNFLVCANMMVTLNTGSAGAI